MASYIQLIVKSTIPAVGSDTDFVAAKQFVHELLRAHYVISDTSIPVIDTK